ncbi:MAG: hypothetical protein AB9917_13190 [Negativicutes bacterium]
MSVLSKLSTVAVIVPAIAWVVCSAGFGAGQLYGFQCPLAGRVPVIPGMPELDFQAMKTIVKITFSRNS